MDVDKSLARFRDASLGLAGIGIIIGLIYGTSAYLAPIKYNTDSLPSILNYIVSMEKDTKLIPNMKESINYLNAKTTVQIGKDGGELRSGDWHTTIALPPGSISKTTYFTYTPVPLRSLIVKPPAEFEPLLLYSFSITPFDTAGSELSNFSLKKAAELYIAYKSINSLKDVREPDNIVLLCWEQKEGKWSPIKTTLKGNVLYAKITHLTLFTLALKSKENINS